MGPYEDKPSSDEPLEQWSSALRLRTRAALLMGYTLQRRPRVKNFEQSEWHDVSQSRSQRIAQFVRNRPRMSLPVKGCFAAVGLAGLLWTLLRKRFKGSE